MNSILKQLGSFWLTYLSLFIYGALCALATFIENDYGTESAKVLIYSNSWFAFLHLFIIINLILIIIRFKLLERKRYSSFLLHFSFIIILLGAGITRYTGFEGILHIREGESNAIMQSDENFLLVRALKGDVVGEHYIYAKDFPLEISYLYSKKFDYALDLQNEKIQFIYTGYKKSPQPKDKNSELQLKALYGDFKQDISIKEGEVYRFPLGDMKVMVGWGPRNIELPFSIELKDFELERYPGSHAPSSYSSQVNIIDENNDIKIPYHIYMNNTLDYGGYRFFQTSYDKDEQGTILSVNNDPGKIPTYIGYFLLVIAFIWILFDSKGRFQKLSRFVKNHNGLACVLCFIISLSHYQLYAQEQQEITSLDINEAKKQITTLTKAIVHGLQTNTQEHSYYFSKLLVQDFGGRIKPIDTLANDFIHKITKKDNFLGMNNTQLFLGITAYPEEWKTIKMIYISSPALKKILGLSNEEKYASFYDLFQDGYYKLFNLVAEVNLKKPSERNTLDKDILNVNERFEALFQILSANALRIIPDPTGKTQKWYSPTELENFDAQQRDYILGIIRNYFLKIDDLVAGGSLEHANESLEELFAYQKQHGSLLIPTQSRIDLEILLNRSNIFKILCYFYLLFGITLFVIALIRILRSKKAHKIVDNILLTCITIILLLHTIGLGIRWYVGGHAPWSNAYESMIYIAWAAALCGPLLLRDSKLAFSASAIMAGISLFVAHLGFMDPQIGNLVPVLKSYWLNIHVSIITASYGFLALSFILGAFTLLLFLFRHSSRTSIDSSIQVLGAINEMSMIVGLGMLSVGTFLGGVWANESWGRYWGWDSKETWSLISMIVYVLILHVRFIKNGDRPYVFASLSVLGFYSILMTYFGVNFYLSGMHSYAAGDPVPIPSFLYYLVGATFLLIFSAGFKSNLKSGV